MEVLGVKVIVCNDMPETSCAIFDSKSGSISINKGGVILSDEDISEIKNLLNYRYVLRKNARGVQK